MPGVFVRKNQTNPPHTTKRKQENMNKKMLLSAFAAVAVSAASAGTFYRQLRWDVTIPALSSFTEAKYSVKSGTTTIPSYSDVVGAHFFVKDVEEGDLNPNEGVFRVDGNGNAQVYDWSDSLWRSADSISFTFGGNVEGEYVEYMTRYCTWERIYNKLQKGESYKVHFYTGGKYQLDSYMTITLPVPEPTSGLMLLLGAGVLALRRRPVRA